MWTQINPSSNYNSHISLICILGYTQILYWFLSTHAIKDQKQIPLYWFLYCLQILKQVLLSPIHLLFPLRPEFDGCIKSAKESLLPEQGTLLPALLFSPWCWHRVYGAVRSGDQKNSCIEFQSEFPTNSGNTKGLGWATQVRKLWGWQ